MRLGQIPESLAIDRSQTIKRRQQQVDVKQIEEAILKQTGLMRSAEKNSSFFGNENQVRVELARAIVRCGGLAGSRGPGRKARAGAGAAYQAKHRRSSKYFF
jgi:hypothetical protein